MDILSRLATLEDALLLLSWFLFVMIYAFTRKRVRLRVFRAPIFLLVLASTVSRIFVVFNVHGADTVVTFLFGLSIAFLIARVVVFVTFDLIVDRKREFQTPALIKSLVFFGLLFLSLFVLNEGLPEEQRVPLTSLLASAAVISVVLGFALQDTLGNLFSGLALHLERPVQVGHWIKVNDSVGKVVETDWRSVKLRTLGHDYHVLPNSMVASGRIINYNDPPTPHRRELRIRAPYSASPDGIISSILPVLKDHPGIENRPQPTMLVRDFSDHWIEYEVRYWYRDYEQLEGIDGDIRRQVWYRFSRDRVASPLPVRDVYLHEVKSDEAELTERRDKIAARLRTLPIIEPLTEEELHKVAEGTQRVLFAGCESIIRQGDEGDSFFVIDSGHAEVWVRDAGGRAAMVKELHPGDYFGEMALLTGERRTATINATTECICYEVDRAAFEHVIKANPRIAEVLSERLSTRRAELTEQLSVMEAEEAAAKQGAGRHDLARTILGKIRSYFGLS